MSKPMTHLKNIISKYEERFDGLLYEFADSTTDRDGNVDSVGSSGFNIASEDLKSFLRQLAADLVREAFANTKVRDYEKGFIGHKCGKCLQDIVCQHRSQALSEVEARQQQFINEQQ